MNLVAGKTEAGFQHRSEAPHPPTKEAAVPADRGRKSKCKATRRSATVHSLQGKRLSGRQKKEIDSIQPPGKVRHPVPVLPPCCEPLEGGISELKR